MKFVSLMFGFVMLTALATGAFAQKVKKVDLAKKIADATPAALPQEPVVKKAKSDAEDENLKGKVKSVIEYSFETRGVKSISEENYFNENGNRLRTVSYLDGFPESVTVWGYLDGKRVLRSCDIEYEPGEKPPPKGISITATAEDNALDRTAPRDRRYDISDTSKYDTHGRLSETASYQNSGELWSRTTYTYNGNEREERDFDNRGQEMSRTVDILDTRGNVIEKRMYGREGKIDEINYSTYDFDQTGNWIVERTYEEKKTRGKPMKKLLWTTNRTITYYQ